MRNLFSKWYLYLLSAVVSTVAICLSISFKTAPKDHERIDIFIGALEMKTSQFDRDIDEKKPDGIKKVETRFIAKTANNFSYLFFSLRSEMDFYILPLDFVEENKGDVVNYSSNIKIDYLEKELGRHFDYYYDDENRPKGFKIYDCKKEEGILGNYITYTNDEERNDYYLFFSFKTKNIGEMNGGGSTGAFEVIDVLFNL